MPSQIHEALLLLFRNRPALAPELLRDALKVGLPDYSEARIESAELTDIQPAEYRADLVVLLYEGVPVYGIVVEAQIGRDTDKRFSWPRYATGVRARFRCPVCLLVVTVDDNVARWAAEPIELGGGNRYVPLVLGPGSVPAVNDPEAARKDPELAVLSAMAHGQDRNPERALEIAVAAMGATAGLDAERSTLYFDLVLASLGEAARKALQSMDPAKYEYQSEFARNYFAQGKAEGFAEGEAKGESRVLLKLLIARFGPLPDAARERVLTAPVADLDAFADRLLTATSLADVIGPLNPVR